MSHFDNDDGLDDPVTLDRWEDNDAWDRAHETGDREMNHHPDCACATCDPILALDKVRHP